MADKIRKIEDGDMIPIVYNIDECVVNVCIPNGDYTYLTLKITPKKAFKIALNLLNSCEVFMNYKKAKE